MDEGIMKTKHLTVRPKAVLLALLCLAFAASSHGLRADDASATATNSTSAKPNNSGINARDRHDATLTPENQKNDKSDLEITKRVRRSLVNKTNELSTAAKNIKVITVNGKVTLRGPVNTEEGKAKVNRLAKEAAGDANVEDQLEVKNSQ